MVSASVWRIFVAMATMFGMSAETAYLRADDRDPADGKESLRILVPAYFYPAGEGRKHWDRLIAASKTAPITAIVNPASGPGKTADAQYEAVLKEAARSSLTLIGYVSTRYAKRDLKEILADVEAWERLYPGLHGYFLDEQSSGPEKVEFYGKIAGHIRRKSPKTLIVANPGVVCDELYLRRKTADAWCIFEAEKPFASYMPPAWAGRQPSERFALLSYGQAMPDVRKAIAEARAKRAGFVYLTSDALPNPWDTLPSYFEEFARGVAVASSEKK